RTVRRVRGLCGFFFQLFDRLYQDGVRNGVSVSLVHPVPEVSVFLCRYALCVHECVGVSNEMRTALPILFVLCRLLLRLVWLGRRVCPACRLLCSFSVVILVSSHTGNRHQRVASCVGGWAPVALGGVLGNGQREAGGDPLAARVHQ